MLGIFLAVLSVLSICGSVPNEPRDRQQKTVLFLSAYQKSPIIALQGLAEEMYFRGYRVLFSVTDDDRALVTSETVGVEFLSGGPPPDNAPDAFTIDALFTGEAMYARSMYDHLIPSLRQKNITLDLIVFEPLAIAAEGLAHTLGVKAVQVVPHLSTLGNQNFLNYRFALAR